MLEMVQATLSKLPPTVSHVTIVDFCGSKERANLLVPPGVSHKTVYSKRSGVERFSGKLMSKALTYFIEFPFLNFFRSISLRRTIRSLKVDRIVFVNGGMPGSPEILAAIGAARALKLNSVLWVHSIFAGRSFLHSKVSKAYLRWILSDLESIVAPSLAVSESFPSWLSLSSRTKVAQNFIVGSTEGRNTPKEHLFTIACPAAYFPNKGQEVLLRATAVLIHKGIDLRVEFFGDGDVAELQRLKALASELSLSGSVAFHGFSDKQRVYGEASLVVLPSISQEAFGLVVLESMRTGIPVLASKVGGIPEIFPHEESFALFTPGDAIELSHKIALLASSSKFQAQESLRVKNIYLNSHNPEEAATKLFEALGLGHASIE